MTRLMKLMRDDEKLDAAVRNLFLKGMHGKLNTLLAMKLKNVKVLSGPSMTRVAL